MENQDEVKEGDRVHFNKMLAFLSNNNLGDQENYDYIDAQMDIDNFMDYCILGIFINNRDWPHNNNLYWRLRTNDFEADTALGHDGRWRWLLNDTDYAFSNSAYMTNDTIQRVLLADAHPSVIFRALLQNEQYQISFLNRFADLLNSHFSISRMIEIVQKYQTMFEPEIHEHILRWKGPHSVADWQYHINVIVDAMTVRPAYQRQHLREHFDIDSDVTLTLEVNDNLQGLVRINTIDICPDTPGIDESPYPWEGTYFHGIPIEVEAKALPGYVFSHWEGDAEGAEPILTLTPEGDLYLKAVFTESSISEAEIIHYWHFNFLPDGTLISVASDYSALGTATITYPGTGDGYMDRRTHRAADPVSNLNLLMGQEPDQGAVLRVRNPSDTRELIVAAPSSGFHDITGAYATTRTSNGATQQELYYSTDGGTNWSQIGTSYTILELPSWILRTFDISGDMRANNNNDLMFRILFTGESADNESGNDRLDNFSLHGIPLSGVNLPPMVVEIPQIQKTIEEGQNLQLNLKDFFEDPENDPLSFSAVSQRPDFVQTQISGDMLSLIPLGRGDAPITVSANDGHNEDVSLQFKVLVYPKAYSFGENGFSFDAWDASTPELLYPEHMLFLQSDVDDPGLGYPLEHAYYIEHDDYHANDADSIGYPYQLTGRSRLNGLGEGGISFINTGRGRDLGGALIALNTIGEEELELSWLGGTLLRNNRVYAIRLQCRIGIEDEFTDLLINDSPVEYLTNDDGHSQFFGDLMLPAELMGQEYVQLLWKYYHVSGDSSKRAQLRLDDIAIQRPEGASMPVLVDFSSFSASTTEDNFVQLFWETGSETAVLGFHVLRHTENDISTAMAVSPLILAMNTSEPQSYSFKDGNLFEEGYYYYWLKVADMASDPQFYGPLSIQFIPTGSNAPEFPEITEIKPIYPNPFKHKAFIPFNLKENSTIDVEIFNSRGQRVKRIEIGPNVAGYHQVEWDGRDDHGRSCGAGVYHFRLKAGEEKFIRRAVLLK